MFTSPTRRSNRRSSHGLRTTTLAVTLALATLGIAGTGPAKAAQKTGLPIQIDADHADFSQKTGRSTYTGNVHMTRGGLTLTGDTLVVTRINQRSRVRAVLRGNPAHIDKKPDAADKDRVTGHARQIEYVNGAAVIVLRGNAQVNRDGNQIRGAVIKHNIDTGQTNAERGKDNQQVHITIQPSPSTP